MNVLKLKKLRQERGWSQAELGPTDTPQQPPR